MKAKPWLNGLPGQVVRPTNYISAIPQPLVYSRAQHIIAKIKTKGWNEQERQYLWPSLYGNHAVTKNTKGQWKTFDRQLQRGKYAPLI